jgi:hypothetical protein
MIRRTLIVLSIGLCVLVLLAWARARRTYDRLTFLTRADTYWELASHAGGFDLSFTTHFNSHFLTWNPVSPTPMSPGWSYSSDVYRPFDLPDEQTEPPDNQIVALAPLNSVSFEIPEPHLFAGFGFVSSVERISYRNATPISRRYMAVGVPFWILIILCLVPALWLGIRPALRRRRRLLANRCIGCGYDLRGSPSGCPECGAGRPRAVPVR